MISDEVGSHSAVILGGGVSQNLNREIENKIDGISEINLSFFDLNIFEWFSSFFFFCV
jgi:hypothetical protein